MTHYANFSIKSNNICHQLQCLYYKYSLDYFQAGICNIAEFQSFNIKLVLTIPLHYKLNLNQPLRYNYGFSKRTYPLALFTCFGRCFSFEVNESITIDLLSSSVYQT